MSGGMWHEARRQEKKIRGMMVDIRRRAERRKEYYEKIKQDPAQFLRIYGRPCKIHLDTAIATAAEGPQTMMPWQGDTNSMIDRFDVRAHLDYIPEIKDRSQHQLSSTELEEERICNYERYRILVQNDMTGINEEQCLKQIYIDERFGALEDREMERRKEFEKKKLSEKKAAIGFSYEDSTPAVPEVPEEEVESEEDELDDEILDADLDIVVDVDSLTDEQKEKFNQGGTLYGMNTGDYIMSLQHDKDEQEQVRMAKMMEEEKAQFAGRKSRRERRAYKEKKLKDRVPSPPSYAARSSPKYEPYRKSSSRSRSRSRSPSGPPPVMQFITSFGAGSSDEESKAEVIQGPSLPPEMLASSRNSVQSEQRSRKSDSGRRGGRRRRYSGSSSSSRSRSPKWRSRRSYSRSRRSRDSSPRRGRYRSRSRDRSRGYNRRHSRSRSRSRSRRYRRDYRSRSRSRERRYARSSSYSSRSRSRSRRSYSRSVSRSSSRSRSRTPPNTAPVIKRYRRPSLEKSEGDSSDSDRKPEAPIKSSNGNRTPAVKTVGKASHTSSTKVRKVKRG